MRGIALRFPGTHPALQEGCVAHRLRRADAPEDADLDLSHVEPTALMRSSDSTTLYEQTRFYDAVGNVANLNTTLPMGTDNQASCYDERNRLTWAGVTGTAPCTGVPVTPGSLTDAQYQQAYSYDTLDHLTSGPLGAYAYGDSTHLHAVTAIGSNYAAIYDAAGTMECRAPYYPLHCSGQPTGNLLSYDDEGRLTAWRNTLIRPTSTTTNLYDGAGRRVEQQITSLGGNSSITYVGGIEEIAASGLGTITTTYYSAGGHSIAEGVNGTIAFLASDGLGSATVALDGSGNATASILYDPYGVTRYTNGAMPGSRGFTNQHTDSTTGLDYYNARYYDAVAGAFVSADMAMDGFNLYMYVKGNPETLTDPTGKWTFGLCIGGSAGAFGIGGFVQGCVVVGQSASGAWSGGVTGTAGGPAYAGVGAGISGGPEFSNANSIDDLNGPFGYLGIGGAVGPVGASGTGFIGTDSKGRTVGG